MATVRVRESKRPRAGRRFAPVAERELQADAVRAIRGIPGAHRGIAVFREVAGPFGIPDFLAVVGDRAQLRKRASIDVPPLLNQVDAGIVAYASPKAGRTVDALAQRLGWSSNTLERRIPGLVRVGALRDVGSGRYVRPDGLVPVGRLYAIETKVKDFPRALRQARRYGLWCDNYVIVMPSLSAISLREAGEAVKRDGGGLVIAGRWAQRPGARRIQPARRLWGSEHVVAAVKGVSPALSRGE